MPRPHVLFALKIVLALNLFFLSMAAAGQENATPMTFQLWKEQQLLEAQNQMLRASAHLNQMRSAKTVATETKEAQTATHNTRIKKAGEDRVTLAEKDLKRAHEGLQNANNLKLTDYIHVYLPTFENDPEALTRLAEKLSKEELTEIFKNLVKKNSPTKTTETMLPRATAPESVAATVPAKTN